MYVCIKRRIRENLGVSNGLVGCVESLRIASPRLNVEYDLHLPGSEYIEAAHGIGESFVHQSQSLSTYSHFTPPDTTQLDRRLASCRAARAV